MRCSIVRKVSATQAWRHNVDVLAGFVAEALLPGDTGAQPGAPVDVGRVVLSAAQAYAD